MVISNVCLFFSFMYFSYNNLMHIVVSNVTKQFSELKDFNASSVYDVGSKTFLYIELVKSSALNTY